MDGRLKTRECPECGRTIRGPAFYRHVKAHKRGTAKKDEVDRLRAEVLAPFMPKPKCDLCPRGITHVCIDGKIAFAMKAT